MAKLIHNDNNKVAAENWNQPIDDDFSKLMDAAWKEPKLKFLQGLSYEDAKKWYEHMLETWKDKVLPTLKDEDADMTPIVMKAIAVKRYREDENERRRLKQV